MKQDSVIVFVNKSLFFQDFPVRELSSNTKTRLRRQQRRRCRRRRGDRRDVRHRLRQGCAQASLQRLEGEERKADSGQQGMK